MLDKRLRTAINVLSHAEGQRHAEAIKRRLAADLEAMRATGASYADLLDYLNSWTPEKDTK